MIAIERSVLLEGGLLQILQKFLVRLLIFFTISTLPLILVWGGIKSWILIAFAGLLFLALRLQYYITSRKANSKKAVVYEIFQRIKKIERSKSKASPDIVNELISNLIENEEDIEKINEEYLNEINDRIKNLENNLSLLEDLIKKNSNVLENDDKEYLNKYLALVDESVKRERKNAVAKEMLNDVLKRLYELKSKRLKELHGKSSFSPLSRMISPKGRAIYIGESEEKEVDETLDHFIDTFHGINEDLSEEMLEGKIKHNK